MNLDLKGQHRRVFITGITGTLGRAVCQHLLDNAGEFIQIVGITRDEQKLYSFPKDHRLVVRLGDVRDMESLKDAARIFWPGEPFLDVPMYNYVFHFAAFKIVEAGEDNRREFERTNIGGTKNVCDLALQLGARVIFTSTDKAVYPLNHYGFTKGVAERIVMESNPFNSVCRYGNVIGSRGSLVDKLRKTLLSNHPTASISDPNMTRFWMTADDAKFFVLRAAYEELYGVQFPHWIRSSHVLDMIKATGEVLGVKLFDLKQGAPGKGEKTHECMATEYETGSIPMFSNNPDRVMGLDELKAIAKKALRALK